MKAGRRVLLGVGCVTLLGCADATSPGSGSTISSGDGSSFLISSDEALLTSNEYLQQDPLGPFQVGYAEFFENPELITDEQFLAHADPASSDEELGEVEYDAAKLAEYAESCSGSGSPGGGEYMMSYGRCETMYGRCVSRVRRIPERRARALGYAACMGAYAACRAIEELEGAQ